ncbi:MAG: cytochrome c biogenesis protein CcsA [Dehalococcoidia bacterium]|nr:cytochrome c biogenesis protein CcsA [Dehalococcoidia bacterium]
MADLSIYLFWSGLVTALFAVVLYGAYVASASVSVRRFAAQTNAGTVTISSHSGTPNPGIGRLATTFAGITFLLLVGAVAARWSATGHPPLSNMYEFTVAFAMGICGAYLAFEAASRQRRIGVVGLPIVAGMLGIATLFPTEIVPLIPALQNGPLLMIHVSFMMVSYAVLTVAFCGAVVYLVQGGEGRRRFAALPSASAAGDLAHKAVMVGFPLLGLGIALGAWWANSAWGRYWGWDPKETSALVTWLSIAAYFHARAGSGTVANAPGIRRVVPTKLRRGWRPDPMWWLILMWALVMFTYFAVNLWVSGLHSYAGV